MFTLENVFEKRAEFENACNGKMPYQAFKRLIFAKTKAKFMRVIFDYFSWIYRYVSKFGLEYDYVDNFNEGFAIVNKGKKWGFVNTKFEEVCELKYDDVAIFYEGYARVQKNDKWGKLFPDGREEF